MYTVKRIVVGKRDHEIVKNEVVQFTNTFRRDVMRLQDAEVSDQVVREIAELTSQTDVLFKIRDAVSAFLKDPSSSKDFTQQIAALAALSEEFADYPLYCGCETIRQQQQQQQDDLCTCQCNAFVLLRNTTLPIAIVYTFHEPAGEKSTFLMMQSIAASVSFVLAKKLYPAAKLPSVNEYLLTAVETFAKSIPVQYIYVAPLTNSRQKEELLKRGFEPFKMEPKQLCAYLFYPRIRKRLFSSSSGSTNRIAGRSSSASSSCTLCARHLIYHFSES